MALGAALLPLWPRVEFRGVERVPPPPAPSAPRLQHLWGHISNVWRCRVCLQGSLSQSKPSPEGRRGRPGLVPAVLDRCYSSGAQVKKLGQLCLPPTITGQRNWRKVQKGCHPDKPLVA
eukprot:8440533-Pyramimonas_sp.AAC.1